MAAQEDSEEDIVRVYGIKMRQQTDFTANVVKGKCYKDPYKPSCKNMI